MSGNYKTSFVELEEIPKFDNVLLELDYFKKKSEVLERDLFKSQTQIKKHDVTIKKLQDHITLYGQNTNNTSNSFLLPSEFKSNWESLVQDLIMEAFENIYDSNILLAQLAQETFRIVYEESKILIAEKIKIILNSLNIQENCHDKFFIKFRSIFQEYFSVIFLIDTERIQKIKNCLKISIESSIETTRQEDIDKDFESTGMCDFIKMSFKLCIYMLLHDPQLLISINLQNSNSSSFPHFPKKNLIYNFYNKSDHLNIEGFAKESAPCLIILPPPLLRSNFPYQGIKPAVYIVTNPSEEILKECEKNKVSTHGKQRSYSSSDLPKESEKDRKNSLKREREVSNSNSGISVNAFTNNINSPEPPQKSEILNKKGTCMTPNITSPKNKIKVNSPNNRSYIKPNSADFTNFKYNYQGLNKDSIKIHSCNKTPPIVCNTSINTNLTISLSSKIKKAYENKSDKNTIKNGYSDQPLNISIVKISSPNKEKPKIEPLNIAHINSISATVSKTPNNPNVSRNSSLNIESFNNSFNKDSLRSNDMVFNQLKTGRTSKNSPTQIDSGRSEYPGLTGLSGIGLTGLNEKLNNISFISIRKKTNSKDNSVSRHEKSLEISNKINNNEIPNVENSNHNPNQIHNLTSSQYTNKNGSSGNTGNINNYSNNYNYNFNFSNNNKFIAGSTNINSLPLNRSKNTLTKYSSHNINNFANSVGNSKNNIYNISNTIFSNSNSKENFSFRNNAVSNNTTSVHNKNTSQSSENNIKINSSQSQSSNQIIEVSSTVPTGPSSTNFNNSFKSKTMKLTSAAFKDPNYNFTTDKERERESPKVSYTSKIKTMVENISAYSLGNNLNAVNSGISKSGKQFNLEYLIKDTSNNNSKFENTSGKNQDPASTKSKSNPPQVIFNGNIGNSNCYEKLNSCSYIRSSHVNTDSNYNSNSQNTYLLVEDSNSSRERRYNADRLIKSENSCSNLNDMKFNGPKRDEFSNSIGKSINSSKVSKMTLSREKSKEYVLNGKIPDVQFSFNAENLNNYIVKKEEPIKEELKVTGKFPNQESSNLTSNKTPSDCNPINPGGTTYSSNCKTKIEKLYLLKERVTYKIGKQSEYESPKNAVNNFVNPFSSPGAGQCQSKVQGSPAVGVLNSNNYSNLNREKSSKVIGIQNSKSIKEVVSYTTSYISNNSSLHKTKISKLNFNTSNINSCSSNPPGPCISSTSNTTNSLIPIFNYTNTNLPTPMARHKKN